MFRNILCHNGRLQFQLFQANENATIYIFYLNSNKNNRKGFLFIYLFIYCVIKVHKKSKTKSYIKLPHTIPHKNISTIHFRTSLSLNRIKGKAGKEKGNMNESPNGICLNIVKVKSMCRRNSDTVISDIIFSSDD